mmetsp:Transcript_19904/g.41715  ORF Transcript_19904/g.41715 Transcript_19904/m.41715 type:complete len:286 (-) Transcript_19904:123-980(-)
MEYPVPLHCLQRARRGGLRLVAPLALGGAGLEQSQRRVRGHEPPAYGVRPDHHHDLPQGVPLGFPHALLCAHPDGLLLERSPRRHPVGRRHALPHHLHLSRKLLARGGSRRAARQGPGPGGLYAHAPVDLDLLPHLVVHPGCAQGCDDPHPDVDALLPALPGGPREVRGGKQEAPKVRGRRPPLARRNIQFIRRGQAAMELAAALSALWRSPPLGPQDRFPDPFSRVTASKPQVSRVIAIMTDQCGGAMMALPAISLAFEHVITQFARSRALGDWKGPSAWTGKG